MHFQKSVFVLCASSRPSLCLLGNKACQNVESYCCGQEHKPNQVTVCPLKLHTYCEQACPSNRSDSAYATVHCKCQGIDSAENSGSRRNVVHKELNASCIVSRSAIPQTGPSRHAEVTHRRPSRHRSQVRAQWATRSKKPWYSHVAASR